jgi:hypothetical protein
MNTLEYQVGPPLRLADAGGGGGSQPRRPLACTTVDGVASNRHVSQEGPARGDPHCKGCRHAGAVDVRRRWHKAR